MTIGYPLNDFHIKKSEHVSHISLYSINPRPQWVNQSVSDICHLRRRLSMRSPRWSIINKVHRNLLLLANHWGGDHNENPSTGNGKSSNSKQLYTYKDKKRREFKCLKHCGFCSNRILLYFPLSVRPSVTGMTSQLFSIIWWFRAWKPGIFWKHVSWQYLFMHPTAWEPVNLPWPPGTF